MSVMDTKEQVEVRQELMALSNESLGKVFRNYLEGSEEVEWSGFSETDLTGVAKFLQDMVIAMQNM